MKGAPNPLRDRVLQQATEHIGPGQDLEDSSVIEPVDSKQEGGEL